MEFKPQKTTTVKFREKKPKTKRYVIRSVETLTFHLGNEKIEKEKSTLYEMSIKLNSSSKSQAIKLTKDVRPVTVEIA